MNGIIGNFERALRFKRLRVQLGFKKRPDVADVLGVTPDTVKKWETCRNRVPDHAFKTLALYEKVKKKGAGFPAPKS